jgi:2'-5' RNA ligase
MSVIRAFIAVDLPVEVQVCLDHIMENLKQEMGQVPVRWVASQNIHLTLKFLGDVSINNLEVLQEALQMEASTQKPMVLSIGGVGAFPKARSPRVIWVGVEAPPELELLQRGVDAHTTRIGYTPDRRPFSPHLTLGRVSRNATPQDVRTIGDVLTKQKVGFLGVARIHAVHLYRSDLRPDGAVYTRLFSAPFNE